MQARPYCQRCRPQAGLPMRRPAQRQLEEYPPLSNFCERLYGQQTARHDERKGRAKQRLRCDAQRIPDVHGLLPSRWSKSLCCQPGKMERDHRRQPLAWARVQSQGESFPVRWQLSAERFHGPAGLAPPGFPRTVVGSRLMGRILAWRRRIRQAAHRLAWSKRKEGEARTSGPTPPSAFQRQA